MAERIQLKNWKVLAGWLKASSRRVDRYPPARKTAMKQADKPSAAGAWRTQSWHAWRDGTLPTSCCGVWWRCRVDRLWRFGISNTTTGSGPSCAGTAADDDLQLSCW
eukprot:358976-Chlamydomonas_euryale.AAC.3